MHIVTRRRRRIHRRSDREPALDSSRAGARPRLRHRASIKISGLERVRRHWPGFPKSRPPNEARASRYARRARRTRRAAGISAAAYRAWRNAETEPEYPSGLHHEYNPKKTRPEVNRRLRTVNREPHSTNNLESPRDHVRFLRELEARLPGHQGRRASPRSRRCPRPGSDCCCSRRKRIPTSR